MLQNDALKSTLVSGATGKAAQSVEEWLNRFGTARVSVSADENLSLEQIELDVLLPLYDDKANLFFTQLGTRRADDRNIMNTGLGYRHFSDKWMWGANTFYDRQISDNHHQRLGFGGELGWDYLKISANSYLRLSDWMASSRYENYDERAANGFDIRTEGYLPSYPQLGASVIFEKYFGNNVDLFNDEDNRQKDPYAVTVGLNYTPFTLMTAGISQKMGKGDTQDTQFNLSFSYAPFVSLDSQLDPEQVAVRRSLLGGRQDLINRNNTIVLDYRKQEAISLGLPDKIEGAENITLPVNAVINSKHGVDRIDWQADELIRHGGEISQDKRSGQYSITLPNYAFGGAENHYVVTGKAFDTKGNGSNLSQMNVYVTGADAASWQTTTSVSPSSLLADGNSTSTVTVKILSNNSQPVTGAADQLTAIIRFTASPTSGAAQDRAAVQAPAISAFKEISPGLYTSTFTSGNAAGTADITPVANRKTTLPSARIELHSADTTASLSTLTASKISALANGTDNIQLTANVLNVEGLPYKGINVQWSADNADAQLSSKQSISDENGVVTVNVSSQGVLNTTVSAHLENGATLNSDILSFDADMATALVTHISSDKLQAVADNTDKVTLTATVANAQNQPLNGAPVDWKIEQGSGNLGVEQSTTDAKGNAQVTLTSAMANSVVVSAHSGSADAKNTDSILFAADNNTMSIIRFALDKTQALADGTDSITYVVTVTDANGNKVEDAPVTWSSDSAFATLSSETTSTDAQGQATVHVTSKTAGDVIISANLAVGAATQAPVATFTADVSTARLSNVTADKTQVLANGADRITLKTTLTDANGNPLANTDVNWSTSPVTGTLSDSSSKTDAQGMATVTLSSSAVNDYVATASVGGASAASPTLIFAADASTATITSLVADKTTGVIAGVDNVKVQAVVLDASGHPVPDVMVSWSSDNSSGQFTPASGITDVSGVATAQFTETKAQTTVITATIAHDSKNQSIDVIADASTAQMSSVTTDKSQAVANGTDAISWTTTIKDANQNPVNNMVVNWSSDNKDVSVASNSTQTNASGVATVTATSTKTADAVMTAAIISPALSAKASKVSYVADVSTTQLSDISASKVQALGNGEDPITLSTVVTDANGNPLVNVDVNWSTNPATGTLSVGSTKTDAQGKASVMLSSLSMGNATVTASVNSASKTSPALTFTADASTAQLTTLVADKTVAVVAGKDIVTLTATVLDGSQHPVADAMVTWSSDNASGTFTSVSGKTDASGIATASYTAKKAQASVITASTTGNSKTQSIEFIADVSTAKLSDVTSDKVQALANGKEAITWSTTVKDANQNPVADVQVKWTSDNAAILLASGSTNTDASGVATVTATSKKATDAVITATVATTGSNASASKVSYIADAGTTFMSVVYANKTAALANGTDLITLTTTLLDRNSNPVENADVSWSRSPATGTLSAKTSKTNAKGAATVTLSSLEVGDYKVSAVYKYMLAESAILTFSADAATAKITALTADKTAGIVAGVDSVAVKATVLDASNHPVPGITVNWSSDNASGIFTPVSGVTDANGVATATLTSTLAQTTVIKASTTSSEKMLSVELVANNETAQITVAADKVQATANGTDSVTWKATVLDANNNPVKAQSVDWKSDNASVTLAGTNGQTAVDGTASMTGTSLKSGAAILTATLTQQQRSASATAVSYIGEVSTAKVQSLIADKTSVIANDMGKATYTAVVVDANNNMLSGVTVNWSTNFNNLSAQSSVTDESGTAVIELKGSNSGKANVTATIAANKSSLSNNNVIFEKAMSGRWDITGNSGNYTSGMIYGFSNLGFIVQSGTTGPTELIYNSKKNVPSVLTTQMKDVNGQLHTVQFGGLRQSVCSTRSFSDMTGCQGGGMAALLSYSASENPDLPTGVYQGEIHFAGKDSGTLYMFDYKVTVTLTVQ